MLSTPQLNNAKRSLLERIRKDVVRIRETDVIIANETGGRAAWMLDFRRIFLNPDDLDAISDIFWDRFAIELPFQVGGMESASIPLITAIVLKGKARGTPVRGFYIRKSRKKTGLIKQIEGSLGDEPVVLVDDLIHNGYTFLKQAVLLEALGKKVRAIFAIVQFNGIGHYSALTDKHIQIETLFDLNDIGLKDSETEKPLHDRFITKWYFNGEGADLYRVERKSTPAIDNANVYFGTDDGYVHALEQNNGAEKWRFRVGIGIRRSGEYAISNLLRACSVLYFASKNGKVFALDANTGAVLWTYDGADWCAPSIAIVPEKKRLYVGINSGWFNNRNYLLALDMENGTEVWRTPTSDSVRSITIDPADPKRICVGCADGTFSVFRRDGPHVWSFKTNGLICGGSARTPDGRIAFGSFDNHLYILDEKTGELINKTELSGGIATSPLVVGNNIIVSCLDKYVYCIDADNAKIVWKFETKGRIFADPALIDGSVYIGSDDSRLYELDPATGKNTAFFQTVERITNPLIHDKNTGHYFLTTYANELYCLTKKTPGA